MPVPSGAGHLKARHWDLKDSQSARVLPIAQYDSTGALFLDFGEEVPKNGNASPDVFRLVSLVAEPRAVSFTVSGAIAALVTEVRLRDGTSILQGGATASVYVKIGVPGDAQAGDYSGTLTVHVDGWSVDPMLHMTITVRGTSPAATPAASPTPAATPSEEPSAAPSEAPTAAPSADPTITPPPTPPATPAATPVALSTPNSHRDPAGGGYV